MLILIFFGLSTLDIIFWIPIVKSEGSALSHHSRRLFPLMYVCKIKSLTKSKFTLNCCKYIYCQAKHYTTVTFPFLYTFFFTGDINHFIFSCSLFSMSLFSTLSNMWDNLSVPFIFLKIHILEPSILLFQSSNMLNSFHPSILLYCHNREFSVPLSCGRCTFFFFFYQSHVSLSFSPSFWWHISYR